MLAVRDTVRCGTLYLLVVVVVAATVALVLTTDCYY